MLDPRSKDDVEFVRDSPHDPGGEGHAGTPIEKWNSEWLADAREPSWGMRNASATILVSSLTRLTW
jgi:hypothetical protein